jgi:hypothetical protein
MIRDTTFSNSSKSVAVMPMIFLKPLLSSMHNSLKQNYMPLVIFFHLKMSTHHPGRLPLSLLFITMKEALHAIARTSVPP